MGPVACRPPATPQDIGLSIREVGEHNATQCGPVRGAPGSGPRRFFEDPGSETRTMRPPALPLVNPARLAILAAALALLAPLTARAAPTRARSLRGRQGAGHEIAAAALCQPQDRSGQSARGALEGSPHALGVPARRPADRDRRRVRDVAAHPRFGGHRGLGAALAALRPAHGRGHPALGREGGCGQDHRAAQGAGRRGSRRAGAVTARRDRQREDLQRPMVSSRRGPAAEAGRRRRLYPSGPALGVYPDEKID